MNFLTQLVRSFARFNSRNHISAVTYRHIFQIPSRDFSFNSILHVKMFMEHENKYAYDIMRNNGYAADIETNRNYARLETDQFHRLLQQDWSKMTPAEIFEVFPKFGVYCKENEMCISNTIFDNYIDNLTDNLCKATDDELINIFRGLNQWPETQSIRTRNYIEVWTALDDACLNKLNNWSPDEMLSFISLFYMLNVTRASDSSRKMLDKLANKAKKLSPQQFVQTLFFVGVQRSPPFNMHNLELHLEDNFTQFSVDDLAIISMGFFKSKTPIRSNLLVIKIIEAVIANSKTIHEVSLAALLKIIRYSMRIPSEEGTLKVYKLLEMLQTEIPRLSVMCNVHIALLGTTRLVLHEGCLNTIADAVINKLSQTRLKDLERLVLSYGTFRFTPQIETNFFDAVIDELRKPEREKEINDHGRSFACCVQYFSLMGLHPVDLINKVLNPIFLEKTYGKQCYNYGREVLCLNNIAQIFCRNEQVNVLSDKQTIILSKKYTDYVPDENFKKQYNVSEKMFIDVMKVLSEIQGGSQFVVGDHILSHHQRGDIIICNMPDGTPVPVADKFTSKTFGLIRRPPDNNRWVVLVIAGRNGIIHGIQKPTGPFYAKIEELKELGYHASLVLWNVYCTLDTLEEKKEYLRKCINEAEM